MFRPSATLVIHCRSPHGSQYPRRILGCRAQCLCDAGYGACRTTPPQSLRPKHPRPPQPRRLLQPRGPERASFRVTGYRPSKADSPRHHRIQTQHRVVFLTIDDGVTKTLQMPALMAASDLPATLFRTRDFNRDNPGFFRSFQAQGSLIENQTVSHNINMATQMSYAQQLTEIKAIQDYAQQQFGRRAALFRPPQAVPTPTPCEGRRRDQGHHHLGSQGQRRPHGLPDR